MSGFEIIIIIVLYFSLLLAVSLLTGRKGSDNETFFTARKQSSWVLVAIGMVGTSISGVTFVSVPGMVRDIGFNYMQTVFGFFFGYLAVAFVLLPLYYKLNLTTIYGYLDRRFGKSSYKTGASFFILSKSASAAVKLYVVTLILQRIIFEPLHIPFILTVTLSIAIVWLYTFRSGIKTVVWTDTIQTLILVLALILLIVAVAGDIKMPVGEIASKLAKSASTRIFVFDDWVSRQNFFKQFFSGIFIVIVMTGLDQDIMQKNLTCRSLSEARKNMLWYGFSFIPINFLFLTLGALLLMLADQNHIVLPAVSDEILPMFATGMLGKTVYVLFVLGIISAAYSSVDSAMASLTTSVSVDLLNVEAMDETKAKRVRMVIHLIVSLVMVLIILLFRSLSDRSMIDTIYTIVSYTYGPLLGMYAFGLFTKYRVRDSLIPFWAVLSPVFCYFLNEYFTVHFKYRFGYELLIVNGLITFAGMWLSRMKNEECCSD